MASLYANVLILLVMLAVWTTASILTRICKMFTRSLTKCRIKMGIHVVFMSTICMVGYGIFCKLVVCTSMGGKKEKAIQKSVGYYTTTLKNPCKRGMRYETACNTCYGLFHVIIILPQHWLQVDLEPPLLSFLSRFAYTIMEQQQQQQQSPIDAHTPGARYVWM